MCEETLNSEVIAANGPLIQYGFWALAVLLQIALGRSWVSRETYTQELVRPKSALLRPPPWLFGVVWSVLYFGQSVAAYVDVSLFRCGLYSYAIWLYIAYAVVSTAWNYVFFARRMLGAGFGVILVAWGPRDRHDRGVRARVLGARELGELVVLLAHRNLAGLCDGTQLRAVETQRRRTHHHRARHVSPARTSQRQISGRCPAAGWYAHCDHGRHTQRRQYLIRQQGSDTRTINF